jgi:ribosome modulation factor
MSDIDRAHAAGARSARAGVAADLNPYFAERDANLRLAWLEGHNCFRVALALWVMN